MKNWRLFSFLLICLLPFNISGQSIEDSITVEPLVPPIPAPPSVVVNDYKIKMESGQMIVTSDNISGLANMEIGGEEKELLFENGKAALDFPSDPAGKLVLLKHKDSQEANNYKLFHISQAGPEDYRVQKIPLWMSILPPLIAIALALIFKEVIVSLFAGVWIGAFIAGGLRFDSLYYFFLSFWKTVENYVVAALNDGGHLSIIIFSLLIGGMVAIISRNGGMAGVVLALSKYARSPRSSQFITWLLGVAIFFDDYANTLIVGKTMRSVTDKFKVSREKLAYIVDSTAAPVASIAFITTWIGAELSYIDGGIAQIEGIDASPYSIFLSSLKYSFYPVLTLIFILLLIYFQRDFGTMYKAEIRARTTGKVSGIIGEDSSNGHVEDLSPVKGAPLKWYNAVIPVLVVIFVTLLGLVDTGMSATYTEIVGAGEVLTSQSWGTVWTAIPSVLEPDAGFFMKIGKLIGNSDSYLALLWSSLSGLAVAIIMTLFGKIMKLSETMNTMASGFKTMLSALIILTLAWALAATTQELFTATYLTSAIQDSINPYLMPVIVFIFAALIAFSTGSSWSTMAILYPIVIVATWEVCDGMDPDVRYEILLNSIAVVLAASVLGDHCSPISDTTILSSLASDCNHIDHVRTQLPYALTVGAISLVAGGLSTWMGGGWLISFILLVISVAILALIVLKVGKPVPNE